MLTVSVLCSDARHPVYPVLQSWVDSVQGKHAVELVTSEDLLSGGDFLFLVSCSIRIRENIRQQYSNTLVIHASDLPQGRGWSPHIWDVLNGKSLLTLSVLDAEDEIDSGNIWLKMNIELDGTELFDEINQKIFLAELRAMDEVLLNHERIQPEAQPNNVATSYHRKRTPADSQLDPEKTISEQFNLLRVCDPNRFPAFFEINGVRYNLQISKEPLKK